MKPPNPFPSLLSCVLAVLGLACGPQSSNPGVNEPGDQDAGPAVTAVQPELPPVGNPQVPEIPSVPYEPKEPEAPEEPEEPEAFPRACPSLYDENTIQDFHVEMGTADWEAMKYEHANADELRAEGKPVEVYRPLSKFQHEGNTRVDAVIRLRGNPSYWSRQEKMQFQISFKEKDPEGRYKGLRKLVLDSAHYNRSYLRDRVAMWMLREAGVPAPCVNHARLYVNGTFYGLYTNIEKVDREFLERNFEDPSQNLWKRGRDLKTNEDENPDTSANSAFWKLETMDGFAEVADAETAVLAWAAEALFTDADGYWAGGWNFYWYEDPSRGFVYIPWDIDLAFETLPVNTDPLTWHKSNDNFHGRPHVDLVLGDQLWRQKFIDAVETVRKSYDVEELDGRIQKWAEQIKDDAARDPHAPWTYQSHRNGITAMRNFIKARSEFIDGWISCVRQNGSDSSVCL